MTSGPEKDEQMDDVLDPEDELLSPDEEPESADGAGDSEPAASSSDDGDKSPDRDPLEPDEDGGEEVEPAAETAPRTRRRGPLRTIVFLALIVAIAGLGWYASILRTQVADLKTKLADAESQASGIQREASRAAADLMPLVEERAVVAKLRGELGDKVGAAAGLEAAKKYAGMASRLSSGRTSAKLAEMQALIEEIEESLGGEPEADAEGQESGADEEAAGEEEPAPIEETPEEGLAERAADEPDSSEADTTQAVEDRASDAG